MAKKKRFAVVYEEEGGLFSVPLCRIIIDNETGVNYLCSIDTANGGISGITPLLDSNGNVVVTIPEKDPFE